MLRRQRPGSKKKNRGNQVISKVPVVEQQQYQERLVLELHKIQGRGE